MDSLLQLKQKEKYRNLTLQLIKKTVMLCGNVTQNTIQHYMFINDFRCYFCLLLSVYFLVSLFVSVLVHDFVYFSVSKAHLQHLSVEWVRLEACIFTTERLQKNSHETQLKRTESKCRKNCSTMKIQWQNSKYKTNIIFHMIFIFAIAILLSIQVM